MNGHVSEGALRPLRIDALDGVRGLAILLVLSIHLHWTGFGWIGVQLFFVLSGFLITRILLQGSSQLPLGPYLRDFYLRRVLRIFPLYFGYLLLVAAIVCSSDGFPDLRRALPYAFTFTLNFFKVSQHAMAPDGTEARFLSHFWSLCVEEHFYLVWPLLIYFLHRNLRLLALGLIAAGPLLRALTAWLWPALPPGLVAPDGAAYGVYQLSLSHVDAFATGALLCVLPAPGAQMRRHLVEWLPLGIVAAVLLGGLVNGGWITPLQSGRSPWHMGFPSPMPNAGQYIWGYTLVNLLGGLLLWLAIHVDGYARVFSQRWLRHTGKISYGMYVLHFPLLMVLGRMVALAEPLFGRGPMTVFGCQLVYIALVYAIAELSYRCYELRFLRLKDRLPRPAAGAGFRHALARIAGSDLRVSR